MKDYENTQALGDFVSVHDLRDDKTGNIIFKAIVTVSTEKNKITNQQITCRITFDGYNNAGTLKFVDDNLDPQFYPTEFDAKWQLFKHVDEEFLTIEGKHTQNQDIGSYLVKIIPIH